MQTSQEELKSTNEELQSTNEELQSTNEELTTSKEEMQSLNEELQTVNPELQAKVDELSRANNDMKNLLNSTDIATLFLDSELNVRRFTTPTTKIIKLIPGDVGRPITDLALGPRLPGPGRRRARGAAHAGAQGEASRRPATAAGSPCASCPTARWTNVIDGVVITFTDVTGARALETALSDQASQLRQMAESLPEPGLGLHDADGSCDYISRQWVEYTGIPDTDQLGSGWLDRVHPDDRERVGEEWRAAVRTGKRLDVEFRIRAASGEYRWFKTRSVPIRDAQGTILKWYGTSTDVDDLKRREETGRLSH